MDFTRLYQTTLLTEMPDIINNNFQAVSDYIDVFYDENQGIIISPINTPGRIKGGTGEFVSLTVDNLIVKSQYTNLYENITTANYDYWVAYTGILTGDLRDACTSLWEVSTGYKYIDVEKPYYKIIPSFDASGSSIFTYYAPKTDNKSQIVQFILDPSGVEDGYYRILVDPTTTPVTYLDITVDSSLTASEQTKWVSLICTDYDASLGPTWEVYAYGVGTPTGSGGAGGGVTPAYVAGEIAVALVPYATTASVTSALSPYATNTSVGLALTPYATNASVNTTINGLTSRHNFTETSLYTLTTRHNYTETSLYSLTNRTSVIDTSIAFIKANYIPNASLSTNFSWSAGILDISITGVTDIATLTYVNASLAARDNSLNNLTSRHNFTETSVYTLTNRHNLTEVSLYTLTGRHNLTETSLYTLTGRHNLTEASLYALTGRHNLTEASLYALTGRHNFTETSLYTLTGRHDYTETSLYTLTGRHNITETSLGALTTTTLSFATNASLGTALQSYATITYVDTSINDLRAVPIKDTCLGGGLSWSTGVLYVDVSTIAGGVTLAYADGSLVARDASITTLFNKQRFTESSLYTLTGRHNLTEASLYALTLRHNITETSLYVSSALYIFNASLSNDFNWNAGMLEVSVGGLTDVATISYVDGSLATRDAAIAIRATNASVNSALTAYATNSSVNLAFYSNASLGLAFNQYTNVSLGLVGNLITNTSLGNVSQLTYAHNASIAWLDASIKQIYPLTLKLNSSIGAYATNASVNTAFLTNTSLGNVSQLVYALNTSIGSGLGDYATNTSVNLAFRTNSSLGNVSQLIYATNSSIGAYATNASVNTAIANFATNASVNLAFLRNTSLGNVSQLIYATNSSIGAYATNASVNTAIANFATNTSVNNSLAFYIKSASTGTTLYWSSGMLNVSTGTTYATYAYVDGSFLDDQNQINALAIRVTALETSTGQATFAYVDGSLLARDASIVLLLGRSLVHNTSIGLLDASMKQIYPLVFRMNTSIGSYATNASVNLAFAVNSSLSLINSFNTSIGYAISRINVIDNSTFYWKTYVDGSLSLRDGNISTLNSLLSTLTTRHNVTESSVYTLTTNKLITDTSLYALNASLNDVLDAYGIFIPEVSLNDTYFKWTSGYLEPSVSGVTSLTALTDVSIVGVAGNDYLKYDSSWNKWVNETPVEASTVLRLNALFDVSIVDVSAFDYLRYDASWGKWVNERTVEASVYYYTKTQVDASFALKSDVNASLNNVASIYTFVNSSSYYDGSLNNIRATYIPDVSLNDSYFRWVSGYLEASVVGSGGSTTLAALTDVSIVSAASNNLLQYDSSFGKWRNVAPVDACSYFYTKTQVDASFVLYTKFNASIGALNASLNDTFLLSSYVNTSEYYDGSLNRLNASLNSVIDLSTLVYMRTEANAVFIREVSLNDTYFKWSAGLLEPSVAAGDSALVAAINTSVGLLEASIGDYVDAYGLFIPEASLSDSYFIWSAGYLEVSAVGSGGISQAYVDGSIANFATNVSVNLAFATNSSLALINAINTSVGLLNSSLNDVLDAYGIFIPEVSLNKSYLKWNAGLLETSTAAYATNSSVNLAFITNVSLGLAGSGSSTLASLTDVSIKSVANNNLLQYDSSFAKWMNVAPVDACSYFYTKTQVDASFALLSMVNASIGALNASLNDTFLLSSYVNTSEYYDGSLNRLNASLNSVIDLSVFVYMRTEANAIFIREVSLNDTYFKWSAGLLEPSVAGSGDSALVVAMNTSVGLLEASIGDYVDAYGLFIPEASLSDSYFIWSAGYLEVSAVGSGGISQAYVDGSIANFATNASVNTAFITNTSLGTNSILISALNTSIGLLNSSLNDVLDAYGIFIPEVSLSTTYFTWDNGYLEVSAGSGDVTKAYVDGSIANFATNASVNTAFITNVSLGLAGAGSSTLASLTDVSIKSVANNNLLQYDSSFAKWMNVAPVDACSYFYTKTQVDASFALLSMVNASIGALNASLNDTFLLSSYVNTSSYYDGSLNNIRSLINAVSISTLSDVSITNITNNDYLRYDSVSAKWINEGSEDISTYFYTKSQIDASFLSTTKKTFQTLTIVDVSTDWNMNISYNAKVTLTQDISLNILNLVSGDSGTLVVRQDGTGSRLITLPIGSVKNGAWTLSTNANAIDVLSFLYDGSFYWNKGGPYT